MHYIAEESEEEDDFEYALELSKEPTSLVQEEDETEDDPDRPLLYRKEDEDVEMEVPLRLKRMLHNSNKPKQKVLHRPYFTIFISLIDVLFMVYVLINSLLHYNYFNSYNIYWVYYMVYLFYVQDWVDCKQRIRLV